LGIDNLCLLLLDELDASPAKVFLDSAPEPCRKQGLFEISELEALPLWEEGEDSGNKVADDGGVGGFLGGPGLDPEQRLLER
jgi:hypothetical protein